MLQKSVPVFEGCPALANVKLALGVLAAAVMSQKVIPALKSRAALALPGTNVARRYCKFACGSVACAVPFISKVLFAARLVWAAADDRIRARKGGTWGIGLEMKASDAMSVRGGFTIKKEIGISRLTSAPAG